MTDTTREFFCPGCRSEALRWLLEVLAAEDHMYLFAEPVTEEIAPTYFEVRGRNQPTRIV